MLEINVFSFKKLWMTSIDLGKCNILEKKRGEQSWGKWLAKQTTQSTNGIHHNRWGYRELTEQQRNFPPISAAYLVIKIMG